MQEPLKLNKEAFSDSPSITHFELKILCLQCSELICENIINSQSVGLLPRSSQFCFKYSISKSFSAKPSLALISLICFDVQQPVLHELPKIKKIPSTRFGTYRPTRFGTFKHYIKYSIPFLKGFVRLVFLGVRPSTRYSFG